MGAGERHGVGAGAVLLLKTGRDLRRNVLVADALPMHLRLGETGKTGGPHERHPAMGGELADEILRIVPRDRPRRGEYGDQP